MGVAFGAVALKRRSLWSAAAFHTGYNTLLVVGSAWAVGFDPSRMWEGVAPAGSGFDNLRAALILAVAQGALATAAVVWWRGGGVAWSAFARKSASRWPAVTERSARKPEDRQTGLGTASRK